MPDRRPAQPDDWNTEVFPQECADVSLGRTFSLDELAQIKVGVIPEQMEDKWFVYWQDDGLFFYRSWTGFCIYIVDFDVTEDGADMTSAVVNRDSEQYTETDDARDAEMISYLIDVLLLRRPASFPATQDSPEDQALEQWSVVGRAGLGRHPNDPSDGT